MISVIFDPEAKDEFWSSIQYYEECQSGLGRRFRDSVEAATRGIVESPFRFRILHAPFRRYLLPKFPFSIIYSLEPDHIRIIAVAHTKREPGYWLKRIQDSEREL